MTELQVRIRRLPGNEDVPLPSYQSEGAVGMDLHAAGATDVSIAPGMIATIPCGFALTVHPDQEAQVRQRSGLESKNGI